jgi:hypothetical protein
MVELSDIQTVYYMIAATGVLVAVFYNIQNIRGTSRNRRVNFTTNLINKFTSKEGLRDWYELMGMRWENFDDFKRKYDSSVNPENFIQRLHFWNMCDHVGWQLIVGAVDWSTISQHKGWSHLIRNSWIKFKPIIEEYRKMAYNTDDYGHWEYLADRMEEILSLDDKRKADSTYGTYRY